MELSSTTVRTTLSTNERVFLPRFSGASIIDKRGLFVLANLLIVFSMFVCQTSFGQAFTGTYPFTSVTTTSGLTDPTAVPTATGVTFGSFSASITGQTNSTAASRFAFSNWPTGATNGSDVFTGSVDAAKYMQVTVTAAAGYSISLSSITFTIQRSATGPRQWVVRSNADTYAANLQASISPSNANLSVVATNVFQVTDATTAASTGSTITLSGANFTLASGASRTFRFYALNAEATGGTFSIDDVVISGTATASGPTLTWTPASNTTFTATNPSAGTQQNASISGVNLTGNVTITAPSPFEVFDGTSWVSTYTITASGTLAATNVPVRIAAGTAVGAVGPVNITAASTGATTVNYAASGSVVAPTPIISQPSAITGLNYGFGSGPSAWQSYTFTASNLTPASGNITITGSTNFEVSSDGVSAAAGNSYTVAYTGGSLASTTTYVRLKASLTSGTYGPVTGVTITGGGATTINVSTTGVVSTPFTGGNIVIEKIGDGTVGLTAAAAPIAVDEFTTSGSLVRTLPLNNSAIGTAPFITAAGSSGQDGLLTLSPNSDFLVVPGYNTANATASAGAVANRSIGYVNANGISNIQVTTSSFLGTGNFRSVCTDGNGTSFWGAGGSGYNHLTAASGTPPVTGTANTTALGTTNSRAISIFNGQLFYTTGSGTPGVYRVGTGLPTANAAVAGVNVISAAASSPNQFSFNPTHDVCYVADNGAAASNGGVRKYTRSGSTWTLAYVLGNNYNVTTNATGTNLPCIGLVVDWSGANPVIYASETSTTGANRVFKIVDDGTAISTTNTGTGALPTITALTNPSLFSTAATNFRLAGVAFAPRTPSIMLSSIAGGTTGVAPYSNNADSYTQGQSPVATSTASFTVNAKYLSANATVVAPANFEISQSATSWTGTGGNTITLTQSGGLITSQTIYIRLAAGLTAGTYTGNITVKSTGCPQWGSVFTTGLVSPPNAAISSPSPAANLTGLSTVTPAASAAQTFTLTAANMTSALTLQASSPFEISTPTVNGGAYASSLNVGSGPSFSGVISVRIAASATAGIFNAGTVTTSTSDVDINALTIANLSGTVYSGAFTAGNIAVEVVGDGTSALNSSASQVNIWEYNPSTGFLTNTFTMPRAAVLPTSAPFNITESGSATSGGQMIRSSNGAFLSISGYNATVGAASVVSTTNPSSFKRVLGTLGSTGIITTSAYDFFSGNNFRSTASNGYSFWCAGTVNAGVGLYYLQNRNATPVSLGSINTRVVNVFGNNLYFSSASTGGIGVYQAGSNGLPVKASDAAVTRLTDNTYATTAGGSPYAFSINPAGNILYITDDQTFTTTSTQRGGVIKYTKTGSTWTYQYTLQVATAITNGARGLDVDWSGANPVLYITSSNGNQIYKLTDTGVAASGSGTLLATAPTNYAFRGLQLAPVAISAELTCTANALDFGAQPPLGVSAEKVFNVSGSGFTGNITVSVPATTPTGQYGLSLTAGGPYTNTVTITASGSPNTGNATVYMVLRPTTEGTYNGNLTISATGATTVTVPVTGACVQPVSYYNAANTDVTSPLNWGTNTDGSGTKPVNFTDNGQYFNIVNTPSSLATMQTSASLSPINASTTSASNLLTFSNPPSCPSSPSNLFVGAAITGAGIPAGTTITDITGNVITMSQAATATATNVTASVPVAQSWTISGTLSKLIVGNGTTAVSFTIPSVVPYNGLVDVKDLGTLVLQNNTLPTLGVLTTNSTVNYNQTGASTVVLPTGDGPYGNLTLQGSDSSTDIRTLPASSPISLPFQILGNWVVDNVTVKGATGAPFTYMGLQGNLTGSNGAIFGGSPVTNASTVPSLITLGNGNQTFSFPNDTIGLYALSSTKSAGTFTLAANTTLLTYGQSSGYAGSQFIYSGTASFVSGAGSVMATTSNANLDVTCTGTASFTLGGDVNASSPASTFFTPSTTPNGSVQLNMAAGTSFNDGGNTITVTNHFGADGEKASYNLTGTLVMASPSGITRIQNNNTSLGMCVADLNNLTIATTAAAGNVIVQPLTGNNTLTVKGNLTLAGTATASKLQPNANTIELKGNFNDTRTVDMISAGTSTFLFNGGAAQTFTTGYASGESFYNVVLNNAAGLTLTSGDMRIGNPATLTCQDGILTTGTNKVILNATANISETATSYVWGNVESTRNLTNATNAFGNMGLTFKANGAQPGSTVVLRNTGTARALGCGNASVLRSFTVTPTVTSGLNANVSFTFNPDVELNGLNQSSLELYNGNDSIPDSNISVNTISYAGIDSVSVLTAAIPAAMWYVDADGDGYTLSGSLVFNCTNPGLNYVSASLGVDCDDADANAWRTGNFYVDADGDLYRVGSIVAVCYGATTPSGYVRTIDDLGVDCDDTDAAIFTDINVYVDADGDSYGTGTPVTVCAGNTVPAGYVTGAANLGTDCDDTDATIWRSEDFYVDADGDFYRVGSIVNLCFGATYPAGYVRSIEDLGVDCDDTDATVWSNVNAYVDADGDGYGIGTAVAICSGTTLPSGYVAAASNQGTDCDDTDASIWRTGNFYTDADGDLYRVGSPVQFCYGSSTPAGYVLSANSAGIDCDDTDATIFNGLNLYVDADGDGRTVGGATFSCIGATIPTGFTSTSLGADCNDADATVWQSETFYTDADADGYHGSATTICYGNTVPPGATTTLGTDCNDANPAINSGALEVCDDLVDNDCDGVADENCNSLVGNDSPSYATNVVYSSNMNFPNCYTVNGNLTGSTDSPQSAAYTGIDEWYKFTAVSTAASITMNSTAQDDFIALYTKTGNTFNLVASENAASFAGDFERMNVSGLTPGTQYFISVGAASGTTGGAYVLCIQNLMPTGCNYAIPAGGFNLCNAYKATFRGSGLQGVTYNYNFAGVGGGATDTSSLTASNLIVLSNPTLALQYGGMYDVQINVNYALQDGGGATDNIVVLGSITSLNCNDVTMMTQPSTAVRLEQRCSATLTRGTYLNAARVTDAALCGVLNYTFEFTQVTSCANSTVVSAFPLTYTTAGASPYLQLNVLPNLGNMGAWNVRIRPNFTYDTGTYGPVQRIQVTGTSASGELLYEEVDMEKAMEEEYASTDVYPNPSNGESVSIAMSGLQKGQLQVRVMDAAGRAVLSRTYAVESTLNTTLTFDDQLSAGVYMIEMTNAGQVKTERWVVQ